MYRAHNRDADRYMNNQSHTSTSHSYMCPRTRLNFQMYCVGYKLCMKFSFIEEKFIIFSQSRSSPSFVTYPTPLGYLG